MRRLLVVAVGLLGAAVAVVPSLAIGSSPPSSASFKAIDFAWEASGGGNQVVIAQGGTVSFSYPTGTSDHNADFASGPAPSACTQTSGTNSGAVPPLPHQPTAPGWAGTCTFNTPGTYTFQCDFHPFMTGTIVVEAPGTTTGTTTTTSPTTVTTVPTTTQPAPTAGAAATDVFLTHTQRGRRVRGSLNITRQGANGKLVVELFARGGALGLRQHGRVRVAVLLRSLGGAGSVHFSVRLSAGARRALHRLRHLTVTVKIIVRPPQGSDFFRTVTVLLRM